MAFWTSHWAGRLRFREEQFFREKREERYNLLRSTVFNFLDLIDVEGFDSESETLRTSSLRYLDTVRHSPFYSEAEKHLTQDIPNYIDDMIKLEESAKKFNVDLEDYKKILNSMVENFLFAELPQIERYAGSDAAPLNSISVERLIRHLKVFWFLDGNFDTIYWKVEKSLSIKGSNIATIEPSNQTRIMEILEILKSWKENTAIAQFRKRAIELQTESRRLSRQLYEGVRFPMERKSYTTVCEECPT